ncbi:MAG TPA: C39 family peptidase [Patescibacteria group bacterium]
MSYFKKILAVTGLILIAGFVFLYISDRQGKPAVDSAIQGMVPEGPVSATKEKNTPDALQPSVSSPQTAATIPDSVLLDVPFLAQAPFGIWDPLHEDACEEASLVMVKHFLAKDKNLTPISGDVEIRKMIQYEEKNGYGISISMEQLKQIAKEYSAMLTGRVQSNATIDDIKQELSAGRPVIVPAAGKILPNPNFRNGGPNYHMLVVVGYDKNGFITNDPGTRKGEGFRYTFEALYYAMHDWDETNVLNGQKAYLVFD